MAGSHDQRRFTKVPELRRGDTVVVLTGKDAGKRGTIERVVTNQQGQKKTKTKYGSAWTAMSPLANAAVVVEGLNIAKRHTKPRQTTGRTDRMPKIQQGGIIDVAQPMSISKVMLVCPHCNKPARVGYRMDNDTKERFCKNCGQGLASEGAE